MDCNAVKGLACIYITICFMTCFYRSVVKYLKEDCFTKWRLYYIVFVQCRRVVATRFEVVRFDNTLSVPAKGVGGMPPQEIC